MNDEEVRFDAEGVITDIEAVDGQTDEATASTDGTVDDLGAIADSAVGTSESVGDVVDATEAYAENVDDIATKVIEAIGQAKELHERLGEDE